MGVDGLFSQYYSEFVSEKIRDARQKLVNEGKCPNRSPIGYLDEGSDNKPLDPERAPLVKRLFELYSTGEWSYRELAKWANKQGLTRKPMRRQRTQEEILNNVDMATIPQLAHPLDHKTIETILKNPFYIGKVVAGKKEGYEGKRTMESSIYRTSTAHQPLIDNALFNKVQEVARRKQRTIHYEEKDFFTYRGLLRCTCGRSFSPYMQKGIIYYRSRCKEGCDNPDVNIREDEVSAAIQTLIDGIYFTDEELLEIEADTKQSMDQISEERNRKLYDLQDKQKRILADMDYLAKNRITLMRTAAMNPEDIHEEVERLEAQLELVGTEIKAQVDSAPEMLKYVLRFSELVKNAGLYFQFALDSEKRDIVTTIFSELVIRDRSVEKYTAKDGFDALLKRSVYSCAPGWI